MEQNVRPLHGVKVVELATFIAGPSCARYLADLGAEVIKVEAPGGDPLRYTAINEGRPTGDLENTSFDLDNANKYGICLDIKVPEGREVLEKLIERSDVFLTNVRYKSLIKSGLDYETLKAKYPKLVMGYVSGYGELGPDKDLPGFDFTAFFARGGILGTLFDKSAVPMLTMPGFGDHPLGLYLANGIIAALYRARETGQGDKVTVSLLHSAIWAVSTMLQGAQYGADATQYPMSRKDISNPLTVVHKTKDDRWIQFAAPAYDSTYNRFMTALGREDLVNDPRYFPQANLQSNLHEFYDMMVEEISKKTLAEWCETFKKADIPYAIAQTWDELLQDEQAWSANCFYRMQYANGNERTLVRPPIMFQDTPLPEYNRGPYLGEQTESILAQLGYTQEQIHAMMKAGAAYHPEPRVQ
jgi:cinnamoyl-CoA:phenyllactate CoA-transferase